jgi:phage shock protein PspC (stress-responsive transcriptional regulator)
MDTAHSHPHEPQPLGASLRRSSDDRILLGLCAGLARTAGISTLAARLATVLISFLLLPFVLLTYTVTAVLVPRDDGAALVGSGWRDRRDVWIALALTLLAAPAALSAGSDGGPLFAGHFGFVVVPLIALTAVAFLAVRRDRDRASARADDAWRPQPSAEPAQPAAAPAHQMAADATAETAATAIITPPASDSAADAPEPTRIQATPPAPAAPTGPAAPSGPVFARAPQPPAGPANQKRPGLTLPVLAAVASVPAFFAILLASGGVQPEASSWAVMIAVMAVVSAAGAVAIAILRPSYLGAGLLVLLAAALGVASIGVGQFGAVLDDGVGERAYRVTNPAELTDPFVLGAGEMNIDLRALRLADAQRVTLRARLGFGEMNIAVPRGVRVLTTRASSASALTVTARENGAAATASASAPTIVLDLRARGVNARVVSGRDRDVSNLAVLAESDLGFWSGDRTDAPFSSGPLDTRVAP